MFDHIISDTFESSYIESIRLLLEKGIKVCPRGSETKELAPFVLGFKNPRDRLVFNSERRINLGFMLAECLWIMAGRNDVEMIKYYNPNIANYSDDGFIFHGAYGPRLRKDTIDQFRAVVDKLKKDPDSRQALCIIWDPKRDYETTKDVPCTISYQFLIRDNGDGRRLQMEANMRSNDVILGLSTDAFNFTMIQELIASELNMDPGHYYHIDGSLHIYANDYEKAERIVKCHEAEGIKSFPMPEMPKNSLQYIPVIEMIEATVRTRESLDFDFVQSVASMLPEYWQQWVYVFACYRALKEKNVTVARQFSDAMGPSHPFRSLMERSIKRQEVKLSK